MKNKQNNFDPFQSLRKQPDFSALSQDSRMRLNFGLSVYRRRLALGLSQTKLASLIGSSQKVVSLIENGAVDMQSSTINRLQAALSLPAEDWALIFGFSLPACRVFVSAVGANRPEVSAPVRAGVGGLQVNNL